MPGAMTGSDDGDDDDARQHEGDSGDIDDETSNDYSYQKTAADYFVCCSSLF